MRAISQLVPNVNKFAQFTTGMCAPPKVKTFSNGRISPTRRRWRPHPRHWKGTRPGTRNPASRNFTQHHTHPQWGPGKVGILRHASRLSIPNETRLQRWEGREIVIARPRRREYAVITLVPPPDTCSIRDTASREVRQSLTACLTLTCRVDTDSMAAVLNY
jgi:hypothetical protein